MSLFGGNSDSNEDKKRKLMDQIKNEIAMANAQQLIQNINGKCFDKCFVGFKSNFDSSEQTCVSKCMERYMEAWNLISQVYVQRAQKESRH